mgnify:CR=1 FL=1
MRYLVLHFDPKDNSQGSLDQLKNIINDLLKREFVDESSILWDEENDLYFTLPRHMPFKDYWISLIEKTTRNSNWKILPKA